MQLLSTKRPCSSSNSEALGIELRLLSATARAWAYGHYEGETETLQRLLTLRSENPEWSYNKLAAQLDIEGRPPRSGGKWHPHAVKRIVTKNLKEGKE